MTTDQPTGADLARIALHAARAAARTRNADAPGGRSSTRSSRRSVRRDGREPVSFGLALTGLMAERAWQAPVAGGSVLDEWPTIAPELAGKVTPVHYDAATGRLDLRPVSPAYATQLRLLGRQLITRINGKAGRAVVRDIRVLPPQGQPVAEPKRQPEQEAAQQRSQVPAKSRETVSAGYQQALAALHGNKRSAVVDPAIAAAVARHDQALRDRREPLTVFADAVAAQADEAEQAARIAAAASSRAHAVRRARADRARRAETLRLAGRTTGEEGEGRNAARATGSVA